MSALVVGALSLSAAFAQPASPVALESARAKGLMESPRLIDKAWGAWLAGRLEDDSLRAMLIEQLRQAVALRDSEWNSEPRGYVEALFDSLIVSGTKVSGDAILAFADCCRTEVLILLARADGQNEDALLDLRSQPLHDGKWLAGKQYVLPHGVRAILRQDSGGTAHRLPVRGSRQ